jgi:hypothetical protein
VIVYLVYRVIDKGDGSWQDFPAEQYDLSVWDKRTLTIIPTIIESPDGEGWDANGAPI